ncbi:MAG: DUF2062 domain-containing protein [Alphaproteobacteria bacterium]
MFKRRKPLTPWETGKQFFWPSMGWKRSIVYIKHRLLRVADSSHKVALGLSIGFGVSFTPLLGTHFIQAGILALLFRGNIFSAVIGTFVGNPWTFPFFWWAGFSFGKFLFSIFGIEGAADFPDGLELEALWDILMTQPLTLFLPWMMGGYVLAALSMPLSYFVYFYLVEGAKKARARTQTFTQET